MGARPDVIPSPLVPGLAGPARLHYCWRRSLSDRAGCGAVDDMSAGPTPGVMTLTVHLPGEVAAALEAEAVRRGQTPDQVAADLLAEQLPRPSARRRLAFAAVGSSTSGHGAAETDDMLAEGFGRD